MKKMLIPLVALICGVLIVTPALAAGPKTGTLLIHIYYNPDVENADLDPSVGKLDINDWPLSSDWIAKWSKVPDKITLRSYTEIGMMQFDLNNQQWPTGWPGFFNPSGDPHYNASLHFRKAIAHLTNKPKIVSDILKGYGFALKTPLVPALWAYEDPNIVDYEYSRAKALDELAAGGFYLEGGVWKWGGEALPPLKIYIRLDDPNRRTAGEYLVNELKAIGFPDSQLSVQITERAVCYQYVMVLYDYNIYTGGWSLTPDPDYLYDLWSSEYYVGWGAPSVGWAPNYPGFCDHEFDNLAREVKYAATEESARTAAQAASKRFFDLEPIVSLWSAAAVKAYKTGWSGVVNMEGYGIDSAGGVNGWSFLRMAKAGDEVIDYGFKSEPEALHVISSQWLWDWSVIGLVYDSLISRNPFRLNEAAYWLAENITVGTWDKGGGQLATKITVKIKDGISWHDGTPFTIDDVIFSWLFTKKCGAGVAWNYAFVRDINSVEKVDARTAIVKYNVLSVYAKWWAGGLPIIPKHIWEARFPNWNTPAFNPASVRTYHPWEVPKAGGLTEMIGTGPWKFPSGGWAKGQTIRLNANTGFYDPTVVINNNVVTGADNVITESFWKFRGDATKDGKVTGTDIVQVMANYGVEWRQGDFDGDGQVDLDDFDLVTLNYGKEVG
jgi:peptide/nickel transport system substrate-binding protein